MNPAVRRAYRDFDVYASALVRKARREGHSIPCRRGCAACCRDVAWITVPEAFELAERIGSMTAAKRLRVVGGIVAWLEGMAAAGLDVNDVAPDVSRYAAAQLVCPLLDVAAGECMAYEVRPMSCRGHYVIAPDASVCANRALEPAVTTLQMDEECLSFALRMVEGASYYAARRAMTGALLVTGLVAAMKARGMLP